jgi:hypothetical protein
VIAVRLVCRHGRDLFRQFIQTLSGPGAHELLSR